MYFLWKRTPLGSIRVSCDGFSDFINRFLSGKSRCRSLSIAEGEKAAMTLVLSSNNSVMKYSEIEERLAAVISPLGFSVQIIWTDRGSPGAELYEALSSIYQNPWTWMLVGALLTLRYMAGWQGFFWTIFWGTAAWFVSKGIIAIIKRKKMGLPPPLARG